MKKSLRLLPVLFTAVTMAVCGVALSGCEKVLDHDHTWSQWEATTPATCTQNGWQVRTCIDPNCAAKEEKELSAPGHKYDDGVFTSTNCEQGGVLKRTCKVCGATNEDTKVEAREHEFEEKQVLTAASCQTEGQSVFACKVCGKEETRTVEKTEHTLGEPIETKNASCKEPGYIKYHCSTCDQDVLKPLEKLKHNWAPNGEKAPTCTEPGYRNQICTRCGEPNKVTLEKLGHDYQVIKTTYPTFQEDGSAEMVCSRCQTPKTDVLPKLQDGSNVEFKVQLYRNNGQKYTGTSVKVSIVGKDGSTLASGQYETLEGGLLKATFPVHENDEYTVKLENLPRGFSTSGEVKLTPTQPEVEVYLTAQLQSKDSPLPTSYTVGSVMNDFSYTTIDNTTITLSDLLKTHKFVYIDIFFITCGPCITTFQAINEVYDSWKEDIAFIAIADVLDSRNPNLEAIKKFRDDNKIQFDVVYDKDQPLGEGGINKYISRMLGVTGYPFAIIIDQEGVIVENHKGTYTVPVSDYLGQVKKYYTIKTAEEKKVEEAPSGLETAMLRGDYLPALKDEE